MMLKNITRIMFTSALFLVSASAFASDVSNYKGTWDYKALQYQGDIDLNEPFGRATFLTTHNSYNAGVYSQGGSYIDPNQQISIYNQLEIGVRAIELDVHYTFSSSGSWPWEWQFSEELKLSHANGDTGTHPNDRYFTQGLSEIKSWLNNNPSEVLIVYLEDHMEGKYDKAISEMNGTIGSLVHKPSGCQSLPMDLTKADILSSGKQILLIGGNCATSNWANYVYNGHFSSTESLENFSPYSVCTAGSMSTDYILSHLVRIFEDSTSLSSIFGNPGSPITATDATEMAECGIGAIGLDQIVPFDSRLTAQIWSWGTNEPNDAGGEDCAVQRSDGRFNDVSCSATYQVACQNPNSRTWSLTSNSYTFDEALSACVDEFPNDNLQFSVPVNGYENAVLRDLKSNSGVSVAWLNYSDSLNEGVWIANSTNNLALGKSTLQSSTFNETAVSSRAVDGNPDGKWSGGSITHTNNNQNEWWQVDLDGQAEITSITLSNRTDCCSDRLSNFYIFISDAPMENRSLSDLVNDTSVIRIYKSGLSSNRETMSVSAQGRYVKIQLAGSNYLSLSEVLVTGQMTSN